MNQPQALSDVMARVLRDAGRGASSDEAGPRPLDTAAEQGTPRPTKQGALVAPNAPVNESARALYGELAKRETVDIGYSIPELIQCTLPHSDPKTPSWVRRNGDYSLILASGYDRDGAMIGIPYGSWPRLALIYIMTRVIAGGGNRRVDFSNSLSRFLEDIGYARHLTGTEKATRFKDQFRRLFNCRLTFQHQTEFHESARPMELMDEYDLWWNFQSHDQGALFESYVIVSEKFCEAIRKAPVPLRTDVLRELKKSPLALDVYCWLTYRLFTMRARQVKHIHVTYNQLQAQFGTGIGPLGYRVFRQRLREAFEDVATYWQPSAEWDRPLREATQRVLNFDFDQTGLNLFDSPPSVTNRAEGEARSQRLLSASRLPSPSQAELIARITTSQRFDADTLHKVAALAPRWDVNWLEAQFWKWVTASAIEVQKDPRRLFFRFVRTHLDKNGQNP